jgi:hypothetical protein
MAVDDNGGKGEIMNWLALELNEVKYGTKDQMAIRQKIQRVVD